MGSAKSGSRIANNIFHEEGDPGDFYSPITSAEGIDGISTTLFADQWYCMWKWIKEGVIRTGFTKYPFAQWTPTALVNKGATLDLVAGGAFQAGNQNSRWQFPVGSRLLFFYYDTVFPHTNTAWNFGTVTANDLGSGLTVDFDNDLLPGQSYGMQLPIQILDIILINPWDVLYPIDIAQSISGNAIVVPSGMYKYQLVTAALRVDGSNNLVEFRNHYMKQYVLDEFLAPSVTGVFTGATTIPLPLYKLAPPTAYQSLIRVEVVPNSPTNAIDIFHNDDFISPRLVYTDRIEVVQFTDRYRSVWELIFTPVGGNFDGEIFWSIPKFQEPRDI